MSTKTMKLIRDMENWGKGVWLWGNKEVMYLSLHVIVTTRMTPAVNVQR